MKISIEFHEDCNKITLRTDDIYNIREYEVYSMEEVKEVVCEYIDEVIKG